MGEGPSADLPTHWAADWLLDRLDGSSLDIADIGCGGGAFAARLQQAGHNLLCLDTNADLLAQAEECGLKTRQGDWLDYDLPACDGLAFVRVFHHMKPLDAAIEKARETLHPGGFLFVEDFDFAAVDQVTADWFYDCLSDFEARGLLKPASAGRGFAGDVLAAGRGDIAPWKKDYVARLNRAADMESALSEHFERIDGGPWPYLYRYVAQAVPDGPDGARAIEDAFAREKEFIRQGGQAIGRRWLWQ